VQRIAEAEARESLSALLDNVERGAEVVITRGGRPVARLVAATPGFDSSIAREAVQGLRSVSRRLSLDGLPLKALIEEGRR
jgi:prevent-host-death family protein